MPVSGVVTTGLYSVPDSAAEQDAQLASLLARARRIAELHEEPFRSLAFPILLEALVRVPASEEHEPTRANNVESAVKPPAVDLPVAEFLAQRRLDSHPDRVVAIAYYYFRGHGGQGVTTKDLVDAYTKSRAKRPQNYPDVIASCVRRGYLVDGGRRDGMKTWIVTRSGEAHVEHDL